jgi:hypothetical protein
VAILLYCSGVIARQQYGTRVVVQNQSRESLRQGTLTLEHGQKYPFGNLDSGKHTALFVDPVGEDSIRLEFVDQENGKMTAVIAGYVESGYSGDITVRVDPQERVISKDNSFAAYNWKSWWAFFS